MRTYAILAAIIIIAVAAIAGAWTIDRLTDPDRPVQIELVSDANAEGVSDADISLDPLAESNEVAPSRRAVSAMALDIASNLHGLESWSGGYDPTQDGPYGQYGVWNGTTTGIGTWQSAPEYVRIAQAPNGRGRVEYHADGIDPERIAVHLRVAHEPVARWAYTVAVGFEHFDWSATDAFARYDTASTEGLGFRVATWISNITQIEVLQTTLTANGKNAQWTPANGSYAHQGHLRIPIGGQGLATPRDWTFVHYRGRVSFWADGIYYGHWTYPDGDYPFRRDAQGDFVRPPGEYVYVYGQAGTGTSSIALHAMAIGEVADAHLIFDGWQ